MPNLDRSVIQSLPVFSAMGEAELDNAIAHARAQRIPKGAAVFRQGERAESFFLLLHGRLKVVRVTRHGQQMIIRFVNPGDIYGIAKALRREDYRATANAVVDCVTQAWPAQGTISWQPIQSSPSTSMQMMGGRLQEAHARIKELSTEEVEHRVAHILLRLVTQSGRHTDDGVLVPDYLTGPRRGVGNNPPLREPGPGCMGTHGASSPPAAAGSGSEC